MLEQIKEDVRRYALQADREGLCRHRSGNFSIRDAESGLICITPTGKAATSRPGSSGASDARLSGTRRAPGRLRVVHGDAFVTPGANGGMMQASRRPGAKIRASEAGRRNRHTGDGI